jgi:hypothetical protein
MYVPQYTDYRSYKFLVPSPILDVNVIGHLNVIVL